MRTSVMSNLSTNLCKTTLCMALNSLSKRKEGCTFLLYEQKQPESLRKTDIRGLSRNIRQS